eukprot:15480215-Alexandrium_andersonii.AAC.1
MSQHEEEDDEFAAPAYSTTPAGAAQETVPRGAQGRFVPPPTLKDASVEELRRYIRNVRTWHK